MVSSPHCHVLDRYIDVVCLLHIILLQGVGHRVWVAFRETDNIPILFLG